MTLKLCSYNYFEKDSEKIYVNHFESFFKCSLNLDESNTKAYRKELQRMCKSIKSVDGNALIIKYKGEEEIT